MKILVIGRNQEINDTVVRLINGRPEWNAVGALTDGQAKETCLKQKFNVVLIGGGITAEEEMGLRLFFQIHDPSAKVIQHFGGGSGLLFSEIQEALKS